MPSLFDPLQLTPTLSLPNRVLMAPLTRARATREAVPTPLMAQYYAQRAGAGLIISEATGISREGLGWPYAPGLWSKEQVEAWKPVVGAVHAAGGRIVAQLWHMGRVVPFGVSGLPAVSASAIRAELDGHSYGGKEPYPTPRAATHGDIARILGDYASAARNAMRAGFDGVQIHGANGYLIDQFLRDSTNRRDDEYGGSIDNRIRFLGEVVEAVTAEVGIANTGLRLSPNSWANEARGSDDAELFVAAAERLEALGVPWIELREPGPDSTFRPTKAPLAHPGMRSVYSGRIVLNSDYVAKSAQARLDEGLVDAISFGRPFIANPDLPDRLRLGAALNDWDVPTFYSQDAAGYTDYPTLREQQAA